MAPVEAVCFLICFGDNLKKGFNTQEIRFWLYNYEKHPPKKLFSTNVKKIFVLFWVQTGWAMWWMSDWARDMLMMENAENNDIEKKTK